MTQEIKEWYDMAKIDLEVAKYLDEKFYPKPTEIICFHCQQSAEKAVKALIVYLGAEGGMPKLHDISFLLNQIKNKIKIEEKFFDYADILAPYGVVARYPNELYLEDRHAKCAIQYSEEMIQWIDGIINSSED